MSKSIEVQNLNIYYGSFLAVEDVIMSIRPQTVTARAVDAAGNRSAVSNADVVTAYGC